MYWFSFCYLSLGVLEKLMNVRVVDLPSGSSQSCVARVNKAGLWATAEVCFIFCLYGRLPALEGTGGWGQQQDPDLGNLQDSVSVSPGSPFWERLDLWKTP